MVHLRFDSISKAREKRMSMVPDVSGLEEDAVGAKRGLVWIVPEFPLIFKGNFKYVA